VKASERSHPSRPESDPEPGASRRAVRSAGLLGGPLLAVAVYAALPEAPAGAGGAAGLDHAGRATAALAVWMGVWWMTEAIALYATALLPLAVLPLTDALPIRETAHEQEDELIFLFMGGFLLALSMQRWGLDRRTAWLALAVVGTRPHRIVGGFMAMTAVFSMWVSNTATAVMMLPIAVSVIDLARREGGEGAPSPDFTPSLLLGIAYAASIGGVGTLIGTPPNLFLASFLKNQLDLEIGFAQWMAIGLPLVAVFLPLTWWLLTRVLYPVRREPLPGGEALARDARAEQGPMQRGEWATLGVFTAAAGAWVFRPLLERVEIAGARPLAGLTDPGIAILAALALFVIPVDRRRLVFVMSWETAVKLPWGLLLLFGGGLSLAAGIQANGVGEFLGQQMGALAGVPPVVLVLVVVAGMIFLTELTSNTATTAALVPILAALAPGLGVSPLLLAVPAAVAASCAFMLPVATPPNAVVFGSGHLTIGQMVRAGVWLNLVGSVLVTALAYAVALPLLGVDPAAPLR